MSLNTKNIKRAWLITDIHFGVRNASIEWLEIHKTYFRDFFIPLLMENKKDGDAIFILGDIFESRQSLNILVMFEAMQIVKELNEILPIFTIIGNHDIYRKYTNDVNSVSIFSMFPNMKIMEKPEVLTFHGGVKALFMPWQDTHTQEMEIVEANDADYLFCHTDIAGFKYNRRVMMEGGLNPATLEKFKRVYTGHIHLAQFRENLRVLGSPFELTRGDMGNPKSVWLLDFKNGKETSFLNTISPRFIKTKLENILDHPLESIKERFKNNFVDVFVNDKWSTSFPFGRLTELLEGYRKLNFILVGDDNNDDEQISRENIELSSLISIYIDEMGYNEKLKDKLKEKALEMYMKAQIYMDEKTIDLS